jgi:hypothetical protein
MNKPLAPYVPPTGDDEPLDAIEQALVRALVRATVRELRQKARSRQAEGHNAPPESAATTEN